MSGRGRLIGTGGVVGGVAAAYLAARRFAEAVARRVEDLDPDTAPLPGERLYLRGRRIHLVLDGEGPPLLLIHGFAASAAAFRRVAPYLHDRFSLIAPDLPGFGFSDRSPGADHSHEATAALLFELLDRLGVERAAVLGHSIGAAIAVRMAAARPERIPRLVLVGGPGRLDPVLPAPLRPLAPLLVPALAASPRVSRWMTAAALAPGSAPTPRAYAAVPSAARVRGNARTLVSLLCSTRHGPAPDPATLDVPALVVTGEHDRYFSPRRARALASALPRAAALIVPGAGHLVLDEQPDVCADAIRRFLREPASRPSATVTDGASVRVRVGSR